MQASSLLDGTPFESRAVARQAIFESTLGVLQPAATPLHAERLDTPGVRAPSSDGLTATQAHDLPDLHLRFVVLNGEE